MQPIAADFVIPLKMHTAHQRPLGNLKDQDMDVVLQFNLRGDIGKPPKLIDRLNRLVDL